MSDDRGDGLSSRRDALSSSKRALLERWTQGRRRGEAAPAPPSPRDGTLPLSSAQQRLWMMARLAGSAAAYNIPSIIRLRPPLDPALLARSLDLLVERHESLRTSFVETKTGPVQRIAERASVPWRVDDLRVQPADVAALADQMERDPFDLELAPLVRARLVWIDDDEQLLLLAFHHLVIDGWSLQIFFRELNEAYAALEQGRERAWPAPPLQYADYLEWQRSWLDGTEASEQEAWWRSRLAGLEGLELPTDRPRPAVPGDRGSQQAVTLPPDLSSAIAELAQNARTTKFMVLLTALGSLLSRMTGQYDLAVGVPAAGRSSSRWEPVIGVFLNTLVLRLDLTGNPAFRETLARVREVVLDAHDHQELPFERVQRTSASPLFNVFFNYLNFGEMRLPDPDRVVRGAHAPFDLSIYAIEDAAGGLSLSIVYPEDRFEDATVAHMLQHLTALLVAVTADPKLRLASLPLALPLATDEQPRVLLPDSWTGGIEQSIVDRFDAQALAHADRVAVESGPHAWRYRELQDGSRRIARLIRDRCGAGEGRLGLLFGHDANAIPAILGALRSGKCYVPLEADDPPERLAHIVEDADLHAILTDDAHLAQAQAIARGRCAVFSESEEAAPEEAYVDVRPDALAYILYTSGSTGRPKGVEQTHRGVLGHIRAYTGALAIVAADRLSLVPSLSVDAAVMDIYGALLNGAALCMFDVQRGGLEDLPAWIAASAITIYHSTPGVFRYLAGAGIASASLRAVVLGGEEAVRRDFELFRERFPRGCRFINGYGPTESTLAMQHILDHDSVVLRPSIPIGAPVAGTEIRLLDPTGAAIEGAGVGEIEIGSELVAPGYWRSPELTAKVFRADGARRRYRTGDLARRLWDGTFEFVGRRDEQVKVNGRRVELGEAEACLASSPAVREACVATRRDASGTLRLIGWAVPAQREIDRNELRLFLQQRLPAYMIPSELIVVEALPRTASGKVDRQQLPRGSGNSAWVRDYRAPRTTEEALLVRMWEEVLGVEHIGIHDNFFDLGGHSLLAAQLVSRIREVFSVELPLRRIFEAPSVDLLAATLAQAPVAEAIASEIRPVSRDHRRTFAPVTGESK